MRQRLWLSSKEMPCDARQGLRAAAPRQEPLLGQLIGCWGCVSGGQMSLNSLASNERIHSPQVSPSPTPALHLGSPLTWRSYYKGSDCLPRPEIYVNGE